MRTSAFYTITPIRCPIEILSTIKIFTSQRQHNFVFTKHTTNIAILKDALHRMHSFNIAA